MGISIKEIQQQFDAAYAAGEIDGLFRIYETDERSGVQKLIQQYKRQMEKLDIERIRTASMWRYEKKYPNVEFIAGIDEVGRGPFAGPVVTAAVILPKDFDVLYIDDSKKLSAQKREFLFDRIMEKALAVGIGMRHPHTIDEINILNATKEAMQESIEQLSITPGQLLVDAVRIPGVQIPQESIIKGDEKSISIAAASIIAKVTRDRMMCAYDELFPGYGFSKHKGYGTPEHIQALQAMGPCPLHRRSFIKGVMFHEGERI